MIILINEILEQNQSTHSLLSCKNTPDTEFVEEGFYVGHLWYILFSGSVFTEGSNKSGELCLLILQPFHVLHALPLHYILLVILWMHLYACLLYHHHPQSLVNVIYETLLGQLWWATLKKKFPSKQHCLSRLSNRTDRHYVQWYIMASIWHTGGGELL